MELSDLFPAVITFVAIGVLLAFGMSIQSNIKDNFDGTNTCGLNATGGTVGISYTGCPFEYNASLRALESNNAISSNLPILGTIIVAAVVIGVLVKAFVIR